MVPNLERFDTSQKCIVQQYIANPLLLDNFKFDMRLYVLVTSVDPLRIFLFEDGLIRMGTEEYQKPTSQNIKDTFMHLTNYSINKKNDNFQFNQDAEADFSGHKRSVKRFYQYLEEKGENVENLKTDINKLIIKTLISG